VFSVFRLLFALAILLSSVGIQYVFDVPGSGPLVKVVVLASALGLFLKGIPAKVPLFAFCTALFGTFISAAFTAFPAFTWPTYLSAVASLATALLFGTVTPARSDRDFALMGMAIFPLFTTAIGIFYQLLGIHPLFRFGRLAGGLGVPAFLGAAAVAGLMASLLLADSKDRRFLALVPFQLVILGLSGARMPAAACVVGCLPIVVARFKGHLQAKLVAGVYGALAAGAVGAVIAGPLIDRFAAGGDSGRELMWNYVLSLFHRYPAFGIGLGGVFENTPHYILVRFGTGATHNDYLRLLAECGMVGGGIVLLSVAAMILSTWASRRMNYSATYLFGALAFLLMGTTDNAFARPEIFFIWTVVSLGCGLTAEHLAPSRTAMVSRPHLRFAAEAAPRRS